MMTKNLFYKNNNIIFRTNDFAIYIPHPNELIGIINEEYDRNLMSIQDFVSECSHGNQNFVKHLFETNNQFKNSWWCYLLEHKNQFLSKQLIDNIIIDLKMIFNKFSYLFNNKQLDENLFNSDEIKLFFKQFDFCNQTLAAGKYFSNPSIDEALSLLSNQIILDLMSNHLILLDRHFEISNLQENIQLDVINHVLTHITFSYWDYQNLVTV